MKYIALAAATLTATPLFAHTDAVFHVHATDYSALVIGLSLMSVAGIAAIAQKVCK